MSESTPTLGLVDSELVKRLKQRDGTVRQRPPSHRRHGSCRYVYVYEDGECPWCEWATRPISLVRGETSSDAQPRP